MTYTEAIHVDNQQKGEAMLGTVANPTNGSDDDSPSFAQHIETAMVQIRWVAVPACFVVLLLSSKVPVALIGSLAVGLALGNLLIDHLLYHHPDPHRVSRISALATGLEWTVGSGIIVGCCADLTHCMPAVLIILLAFALIGAARYGLSGFLGALGADIVLLALLHLMLHPDIAWLALAIWTILVVAASAILGGLLLWLRQDEGRREAEQAVLRQRLQDEEQRLQVEHAALERLRAEERQWQADHAALQLLQVRSLAA